MSAADCATVSTGAAGENPDFDYVAGSSGNASLMAFTRAMGGTAPRHNLRVVGINPGPVLTERLITLTKTRARDVLGDESRWQELMKGHAFGRAAKEWRRANHRPGPHVNDRW